MPIYAYKCSSCGHKQDVLQKISEEPLSTCTACGAPTFAKQLTAAGFQLKGNGWYSTDFKNGSGGKSDSTKSDSKPEAPATSATETKAAGTKDTAAAPACGAGGCAACS